MKSIRYGLGGNSGFTLIELLMVVSIVGMLSSIILASLNNARENARIAAAMQYDATVKHSIGDQMVGEWTFDDAGSGTALDTSGFGNNGSFVGTAPVATAGYNGRSAYSFNNGGILTAFNFSTLNTKNWTISSWILSSNNGGGSSWIFGAAAGSNFLWGKGTGNSLRAVINGFLNWDVIPGTAVFDGRWHNVILENANNIAKIYVDGKLVATTAAGTPSLTYAMTIGGISGQFWSGKLDDLRIYTSALSLAEVEKLYAEGQAKYFAAK